MTRVSGLRCACESLQCRTLETLGVRGANTAVTSRPAAAFAVSLANAVKETPKVAERVKEDITIIRELRALKKNAPKQAESTLDAAAEE